MPGNLGRTSLRAKRRDENPMREFDRLPAELRRWLARAVLPWRARSVEQAYRRAMARTGDRDLALKELDCLEQRLVAKDASRVWHGAHPESLLN